MSNQYKKPYGAGTIYKSGIGFSAASPLDIRTVVDNKGSLIAKDAWYVEDQNAVIVYQGLQVFVRDASNNCLFVCTKALESSDLKTENEITTLISENKLDTEIAKYWTKLGTGDSIETVSQDVSTLKRYVFGADSSTDPSYCDKQYVHADGSTYGLIYDVSMVMNHVYDTSYGIDASLEDIRKWLYGENYYYEGAFKHDASGILYDISVLDVTTAAALAQLNYDVSTMDVSYKAADSSLYEHIRFDASSWDASRLQEAKDYTDQKVKDLGPVFKFKGVARSISADHTTITVSEGSTTFTPTDGSAQEVICLGYEFGRDLSTGEVIPMYAWGYYDASNKENKVLAYSSTASITSTAQYNQYPLKKGDETSLAYYVQVEGGNYVYDCSVKDASEGSNNIFWRFRQYDTSATQNYIYVDRGENAEAPSASTITTPYDFYTTCDSTKKIAAYHVGSGKYQIATVSIYVFTYYENGWSDVESAKGGTFTWEGDTPRTVIASSANIGWVYQIKEQEWASNGFLWIELGSPTDEWIIIN